MNDALKKAAQALYDTTASVRASSPEHGFYLAKCRAELKAALAVEDSDTTAECPAGGLHRRDPHNPRRCMHCNAWPLA